jgi:hypothetical protein
MYFSTYYKKPKANKKTQMNSVYEILVYFFPLTFEWAMC